MPSFDPLPSFDDPDLARKAERLGERDLDGLPFGAVRLDRAGQVLVFNRSEAQLSGYGQRPALGREFFVDIAPCMDTPEFRGRIERARAAGDLDMEFGYVGDFGDRERELTVRVQSASDSGTWLFIRREA